MTPLVLEPPPGPLCWLFPELLAVAGGTGVDGLRQCVRALRADVAARVHVGPGPRGHALAAILREHAPDPWQQVPRVASSASDSTGLEGSIARAFAAGAVAVEVVRQQEGTRVRAAPPTPAHAERRLARGATEPWVVDLGGAADARHAASQAILAAPSLFAAAGLVPVLGAASPAAPRHAVAPSWWGIVDGDAGAARDVQRAVVQALYPDRALRLAGYESVALGGGDLYSEALRDMLAAPPAPAARARAMIVAVCGIDGAGKSSHVRALAEHLTAGGLRVKTHKIYRHGVFHDTVTDLTRRCAGDVRLHLWRVERLAKAFDSVKYFFSAVEPDLATHDVLLFDRYTPTHFAAGTGRCHFDPFTRELLAVYPAADRIFLLDAPVEAALARLAERSERTVDENPYMLGRYHAMLRALAAPEGMVVLDASAPFAANQARIRADVAALWRARQSR